jgi:hypothetical protein
VKSKRSIVARDMEIRVPAKGRAFFNDKKGIFLMIKRTFFNDKRDI